MSLFMNQTLSEFNRLLASREPAPGGGSSAALSGVLGSALTMMVVNLSAGKKDFETLDEEIRNQVMMDFEAVSNLNRELAELAEKDCSAFIAYMEAVKLPQNTEQECRIRVGEIRKASLKALEIPLATAEKCLFVLRHQQAIARYGNQDTVSDVGIGALLVMAGLEGSALNVKINLPGIENTQVKEDALSKIGYYLKEGAKLKEETMEIVRKRIETLG